MSDVKVLIADDEKGIRDIIKEYLLSEEFVVVEAIEKLLKNQPFI